MVWRAVFNLNVWPLSHPTLPSHHPPPPLAHPLNTPIVQLGCQLEPLSSSLHNLPHRLKPTPPPHQRSPTPTHTGHPLHNASIPRPNWLLPKPTARRSFQSNSPALFYVLSKENWSAFKTGWKSRGHMWQLNDLVERLNEFLGRARFPFIGLKC